MPSSSPYAEVALSACFLQNSNPTRNYSTSYKWTFTEYGNGYTFQGLADLINAVGTTCQREHYTFEQTGKGIAWQHGTYELNLFARWGLTYNPQAWWKKIKPCPLTTRARRELSQHTCFLQVSSKSFYLFLWRCTRFTVKRKPCVSFPIVLARRFLL